MSCQYIALGGNLGPVAATFREALNRLSNSGIPVVAVSSFHDTTPVGEHAGATYLNAAAQIESTLSPLELLDQLQAIERALGRTRSLHWGPRTLDLDLLFFDELILDSPRLTIPHPAAWYRRFVLDPLVEIAPDFVHPVKQATIRQLREQLLPRPLSVELAGLPPESEAILKRSLLPEFPQVQFGSWHADYGEPRDWPAENASPASLIIWFGQDDAGRIQFEQLPLMSRFDARTTAMEPLTLVRNLLHAALGE
jgi:2-amino-4-hydroxy-6-hydroxymethyldihydropteridine diphosphokinase